MAEMTEMHILGTVSSVFMPQMDLDTYSRYDVPDDFHKRIENGDIEIFNAPRPLYGHVLWTGDFLHGIFYSAIDKDGEYADTFRKKTIQLDGHKIVFHLEDEIVKWAQAFYSEKGYDISDYSIKELWSSWKVHNLNVINRQYGG